MEKKTVTEDTVRKILTDIVTPLMEKHNIALNEKISNEIEMKVREAIKPDHALPMEIHENLLDDPKGGFQCLSYMARDIAIASKTNGRTVSKELLEWERVTGFGITKAAGTGLAEGDAEYGGYLIPPEYRNEIMMAVQQQNQILPLCMPVPMQRNIVEIPFVNGFDESGGLVWGGIVWYWLDELAQKSESRPKWGKIQLKLKKVAGLAFTSDEILQDSPVSMEGILRKGFADGLNYQINKVLIRGTGAGQPMGILNSACLYSISAETGQVASTLVLCEN